MEQTMNSISSAKTAITTAQADLSNDNVNEVNKTLEQGKLVIKSMRAFI